MVQAPSFVDYRSTAPLLVEGRGAGPEALIAAVCEIFSLTRDQLLAQDRIPYKVEARCTLYHLLYRYGLSLTAIARLVNRHHSTVLYQLSRHEPLPLTPDQQRLVAQCGFQYAAVKTLQELPVASRQAITQYLHALCMHRHFGALAYQGLVALSRYPEWREDAYRFLRVVGELPQASRIATHARQAGLQWVGPLPSFPQLSPDLYTGRKTTNARLRAKEEQIHA